MKITMRLAGLFLFAAASAQVTHASPLCSVGDQAHVLWKGEWYPATVVKVNEYQTRCFIRYDGYGSQWDEWVGAERYRKSGHAGAANAGIAFKPGDAVQVKWKGKWYDASVLKVGNGKYRIHYDQYDSSWDEWVTGERMRRR